MATKAKRLCGLPKFSTETRPRPLFWDGCELRRGQERGMKRRRVMACNRVFGNEMEADVCDSPGKFSSFLHNRRCNTDADLADVTKMMETYQDDDGDDSDGDGWWWWRWWLGPIAPIATLAHQW